MNNLDVIIDYGSQNLRLSVFNNFSESIYSSKLKISHEKNQSFEETLNILIRDAEKNLSTHLDYVNVLYDSSNLYVIDLSIKKSFDQPTSIKNIYENLIEEAKFIVSENNFKDKVLHIIINNIIIDENKKIDEIIKNIKIQSLILEIKFICLSKLIIDNLSKKFKKNNLNISNIYCASYVKAFFYRKKLENKNNFIFLDIGYERTSSLFFYNKKFEYINAISIGGNHITKDISKVLSLNLNYSENLKIKLNEDEKEFYLNKKASNNINLYQEIIKKNISVDLIKQIIQARVDEIIKLSFDSNIYAKNNVYFEKTYLILIGNGSKLLSNQKKQNFEKRFLDIIFFEDDDSKICEAGQYYNKSHESHLTKTKKKHKKYGFFGRFFNFFAK